MSRANVKPVHASLRRKRSARMAAIQGLYNHDIIGGTMPPEKQVAQLMQQWRDSIAAKDEEWPSFDLPTQSLLLDIISGVQAKMESINTILQTVISEDWRTERMSPVMVATLRCAVYELHYKTERRAAMIVDEYVTIASGYFDDSELAYINSAIQRIAHTARPDHA